MEQPKSAADASDFLGMEITADTHDLEPGRSQEQVNVMSDQRGAMRPRLGCRLVTFEYTV